MEGIDSALWSMRLDVLVVVFSRFGPNKRTRRHLTKSSVRRWGSYEDTWMDEDLVIANSVTIPSFGF